MIGKFLASPVGSAVRVFAGLVLGYFVLDLEQEHGIHVSLEDLGTWVAAGLAVAVPIVIAAINPADPRFGRTSS